MSDQMTDQMQKLMTAMAGVQSVTPPHLPQGEAPRVIAAGEAFWEPGIDVVHYSDGDHRDDGPPSTGGRIGDAVSRPDSPVDSPVDEVIRRRHSTRMFLPDKPVPRDMLEEALTLAMRAPSNSNVQPWRLFLATGSRRDRLAEALTAAVHESPPPSLGLPDSHGHLRRQLGALIYGAMGVARDDAEGRWNAQLRNWDFFRAPVAGIVCMHRDLGLPDAIGVGMFLQTLLLALTDRGLDSCVQVSTALYPDVVREVLGIPEDLIVLCGICIGYADPTFAANFLDIPRNALADNIVVYDD